MMDHLVDLDKDQGCFITGGDKIGEAGKGKEELSSGVLDFLVEGS